MKEIQNKTALRFHLTQLIMVKIRETNTWKQRKGDHLPLVQVQVGIATRAISVEFLHKGRKNSPYDPVLPLLNIFPYNSTFYCYVTRFLLRRPYCSPQTRS